MPKRSENLNEGSESSDGLDRQSKENIKDDGSVNREDSSSITNKDSSDNLSSLGRNPSSTECTSSNEYKASDTEDGQDQLCLDMQQKLHLQTDMIPHSQANDDTLHPKSPVSRPRSVFTYASEQERDYGTSLRITNSTPNTTMKLNEYLPSFNPGGNDLHTLNQSSSEYDFTSKYYSPRNTPEFEPGHYYAQNGSFRMGGRDTEYFNYKNNKETQILANNMPPWRSNSRLNIPSKMALSMNPSNTVIPTLAPPLNAVNFYNTEEMQHYNVTENWRDHELVESGTGGAMATPHGTITLHLHDRVRVDMTLDRAVRIVNFKNNIVISVSANGSASGLIHPNGRVYQYGSRVEILAHDQHSHNNKYAKMWYKGVSFTSDQCALVYLVDSAGTRTTTDTFSDLNQDFSLSIFYNESRHGPQFVQEALNILHSSQYWITEDGTENWIINNVRISQTSDGLVRIGRNSNKYSLRTSPANGSASVSSPYVHCTGSLGQNSHLFVRRGERRMHYDGSSFIVRNAGHSAGFDDKHQLKVY